MSFLDLAQDVLTKGVDAYRDVQTAKYSTNEPTPNSRGSYGNTAPAGQPSYSALSDTIAATFANPTNLILLALVAVGVVFLIKRA